MSKVGTINVNVYDHYTTAALQNFANQAGITLKQAESIARERLYRAEYNKLSAKLPEQVAKRKAYNAKRAAMLRTLSSNVAVK